MKDRIKKFIVRHEDEIVIGLVLTTVCVASAIIVHKHADGMQVAEVKVGRDENEGWIYVIHKNGYWTGWTKPTESE